MIFLLSFLQAAINFETLLFPVILLLDQGVSRVKVPTPASLGWLLASIFLKEQFRGSNIDRFTSPLRRKPFDTLGELVENNFYILHTSSVDTKFMRVYSQGAKFFGPRMNQDFETELKFDKYLKHYNSNFTKILVNYNRIRELLYRPTFENYLEFNETVMMKLFQTRQREAYIDTFEKLAK